jgi:DNA-binding NarL/FixJ family response regulator
VIDKILLRGVSSYSPQAVVSIAPLKRVSVFYGQNGTGNTKNSEAVKELKALGLSQAEVVQRLGLAKSTVHRYWQ